MLVQAMPLPLAGTVPIIAEIVFGHQVKFPPAICLRPVCVRKALRLNAWNAAVFVPIPFVPIGGVVRTGRGPVILKLVASCSTGGAYFTSTARRYGGSGFDHTYGGITNPPPLPPPVLPPTVLTTLFAACFTHRRSRPVPANIVVTAICG